jgi:hypothetical protein
LVLVVLVVLVDKILDLVVGLHVLKDLVQHCFKLMVVVVEHIQVVTKQAAVVVELKEMVVALVDLVDDL